MTRISVKSGFLLALVCTTLVFGENLRKEKPEEETQEEKRDIKLELLNLVTTAVKDRLNQGLPELMVSSGLDPIDNLASGSGEEIIKVKLDFCKELDVQYEYELMDFRGLSSIQVTDLEVTDMGEDDKIDFKNMEAEAFIKVEFSQDLLFRIEGDAYAKCSFFDLNPKLDGNAAIVGVFGHSPVRIRADISDLNDPKIKELTIQNLVIDYEEIVVSFDNAGPLEKYAQPINDAIEQEAHGKITGAVSQSVQQVLQEAINQVIIDDEY